jgi:hypothetical protein
MLGLQMCITSSGQTSVFINNYQIKDVNFSPAPHLKEKKKPHSA